ncbi:hypothetical protein C5470_00595 [Photorhabdus stackebrandtii]|uniref:Uncharacterized protein n=1 Tax=Photorhabdus stackebrandtii TaxID=1123042 RepID=A0A7X5QIQ5_9GAMM|nr:hypothetical protein [Photorhabdus stackebrandtii]
MNQILPSYFYQQQNQQSNVKSTLEVAHQFNLYDICGLFSFNCRRLRCFQHIAGSRYEYLLIWINKMAPPKMEDVSILNNISGG